MKISCLIIFSIILLQYLPQNTLASEQNWGEKIKVTDDEFEDIFPSLIQDLNGKYWIAWTSSMNNNGISISNSSNDILISSSVNLLDWTTPQYIMKDNFVDMTPSLIQDSNGKFWIVWASTRNETNDRFHFYYDIWISSSNDGEKWSSPRRITNDNLTDFSPCIMQDRNDKYWVVWTKTESDNNSNIWITSSNDCENWDEPKLILDNGNQDATPKLIQDINKKYRIAWVSNNSNIFNIWVSSSIDCKNWGNTKQVTNDNNWDGNPSFIQDNNELYRDVLFPSWVIV